MDEAEQRHSSQSLGDPREDRCRVGATVYTRACRAGAVLWEAAGHAPSDAGAVWAELRLPGGATAFAQPSAPERPRWTLPDIAPPPPPPRGEWPDAPRRALLALALRCAGECPALRRLLTDEAAREVAAQRIARAFMSAHEPGDAAETFLRDAMAREAHALEARRAAAGPVSADISPHDGFAPPCALSPLLACASWMSEAPRAASIALRRGPEERQISAALGVEVLCAVPAHEGRDGPHSRVFAVARGGGGAFALLLVDADGSVRDARPLLGAAHVPCDAKDTAAPITLRIDGATIVAAFADMAGLCALHDALLVALTAMYGDGCDTLRIVHMRAHSVRFAAQFCPAPVPATAVREAVAAVLSAAAEDRADERDAANARLRQCLAMPAARDTAALCIIAAADAVPEDRALSYITALLRAVHALIDCASPYGDGKLAVRMQQCLAALAQRFASKDITEPCARVALLLDATDRALRSWRPAREGVLPRVPARPSAAALGPGLHMAVLCHSGGRVLTNRAGLLPTARILSAPLHGDAGLAPEAADMQWLLRIAGTDAAWSGARLQAWDKVYATRGGECLRAGIVRAAQELRDTRLFPHLGFVFDAPVPLPAARATMIVCVCAVDAPDVVPAASAELVWREAVDAELGAYALTHTATASRHVDALPGAYRRCVRYVDAALRYSESVTARLEPGFYVGFFVASVCAQGALALVPECNRNLPPLARAGSVAPSAEEWRWLQSLNYRRRVCGSFGFPQLSQAVTARAQPQSPPLPDDAPFEARVSCAVSTLEEAVGLRVEQFYDLELVTLDEEGSITAFFAVAYCPPPFYDDGSNKDGNLHCSGTESGETKLAANLSENRSLGEENADDVYDLHTAGDGDGGRRDGVPAPPKGLVPMTYKLVRIIDDHHMCRYWPRVYGFLAAEADLAERELCAATPSFTSDEALRLRPANEAMCHAADVDRYALLVSCFRPLAIWVETDGLTLVPRHAARLLDAGRAAEEVVDIAVANRAAAADARFAAMRASLLELCAAPGAPAWPNVLRRLREMDTDVPGASGAGATESRGGSAVPLRRFDEVPVALAVTAAAGAARAASVYALPCTLAEFLAGPGAGPSDAELCARGIVDELVDVAAAAGEAAVLGGVAERMVACVEAAEDMTLGAAVLARRADAEDAAVAERHAFLRRLFCGAADGAPGKDPFSDLEAAAGTGTLFRAGSPRAVRRAADGVRVCVARAACDASRVERLLRAANSALHALELAQCVRAYVSAASPLPRARHSSPGRAAAPAVVLVSREGRESPVASLDPFRALALRSPGRVALPAYTHAELSLFAAHMNAAPRALAVWLRECPVPADAAARRRLFQLSLDLQAPLLALRLLPAVFAGGGRRMGDAEAGAARAALADGFLFAYGVRDWLHAAALGGPALAAGLDVLWWARYADEAGDARAAYGAHAGVWARVYAEARVREQLAAGAHTPDERALWAEGLGALVEYVSLRGRAGVGDAEVARLADACPGVRSLDLAGTRVGDEAVRTVCARMKRLVECSVAETNVSLGAARRLSEHCGANAEREGREYHTETQR